MKKLSILCLTLFLSHIAFSQAEIGNEEITITKEREISLPKANRIFEKIPMVESEKTSKKITYKFYDRKPSGVESTNFQPTIVAPTEKKQNDEAFQGFYNYLKLGGGNFGRLYGELYLNSFQNEKISYGIYALHNSTKRGPIQSENSGNSKNKFSGNAKYKASTFEIKANAGYERRNYYFYGYDTTFIKLDKNEIRQKLQMFHGGISIENTNQDSPVDYQLGTNIKTLHDFYGADETDWTSNLNAYFPLVKDQIIASLKSDASISQRTDNTLEVNGVNKRNLFRVEPSFNFIYHQIGVKVGFRAVNQYDQINQINVTKGFPFAEITYKTPNLMYFSIGYDGDIIRNTLRNFLDENPYLRNQVPLFNTEKSKEIFISSKGELIMGVSYQAKISYGSFKNLYFYTTYEGDPQLRRFDIVYDKNDVPYYHGNLQFNYQPSTIIRSNLTLDYYKYQVKSIEKPFHRPQLDLKLTNSFVISDKMVAAVDMFLLSKMYAIDPFSNQIKTLPTIADINTEFDYLFGKQFATFVRINNILGKNYQRFLYYPQQGLNFLVGVNISI